MYKHRTAFQPSKKKPPIQQNIDQVLNQCQVKMKILKRTETENSEEIEKTQEKAKSETEETKKSEKESKETQMLIGMLKKELELKNAQIESLQSQNNGYNWGTYYAFQGNILPFYLYRIIHKIQGCINKILCKSF